MNKKNSPQRKTTLKWNPNGELSEIDMLRILEKISSDEIFSKILNISFSESSPFEFHFNVVFRCK